MRQFIIGGNGGSSGPGVLVARSGTENIADATQTVNVTFSTGMPNTNYSISATIGNDVDADPIYITIVSITKGLNGFTAELSAPTDSANYFLDYLVAEHV